MNPIIKWASVHKIDITKKFDSKTTMINGDTDATDFVSKLLDDVSKSSAYKYYRFRSNTTEVHNIINSLSDNEWEDSATRISNRLYEAEEKAQKQVENLTDLRRGGLLQIYLENDNATLYVITKVDYDDYLGESLKKESGLPWEKRTQKVAIIEFNEEDHIVKVRDTNSTISTYWWDSFLELVELNSSQKNTKSAFMEIDNLLTRKVKKKSKIDYWNIRNSVLCYFRNNEGFSITGLIENTLLHYTPDNSSIDIKSLSEDLLNLPEKKNFDSQFDISISHIKGRIKKNIPLRENLELRFNGEIENLKDIIKAGEDSEGRKFIKIFSDTGYEEFKSSNNDSATENSQSDGARKE
ncbi:MAG: hypothetical protein C9355_06040 [Thalassolituus maritimus]|uniref:Nucleoid-associated protein YejK n=1 Tax=Thalassolituus maritimus TaxID=484498 RepID=A0A1N7IY89_9GAMM|nr:nucleoid-associated protein [Thalassolituus maritimus]TPD54898.1 MAG: hypothetical protein C9355_06040 [Thalassolituus maritimus]SIS42029.1 hypothetical protein SAMN05421686_101136 [Thalassolituus maritimus]